MDQNRRELPFTKETKGSFAGYIPKSDKEDLMKHNKTVEDYDQPQSLLTRTTNYLRGTAQYVAGAAQGAAHYVGETVCEGARKIGLMKGTDSD